MDNMTEKEQKLLIEQYFYLGKQLTYAQMKELKGTKYAKFLPKNISNFKMVQEQAESMLSEVPEPAIDMPNLEPPKRSFNPGVSTSIVFDLVNDIEDVFNIGIDNFDYEKYGKINVARLKHYIEKFIQNTMLDPITKSFLQKVAKQDNVEKILYTLYMANK